MKIMFGVGGDVQWDVHESPLNGEGRVSARYRIGEEQELVGFRWWGEFRNGDSSSNLAQQIFVYLVGARAATGPTTEGPFDERDGPLGHDGRRNFQTRMPLSVICDDARPGAIYRAAGEFNVIDPYLQLASFNGIGAALSREPGAHWIYLERMPYPLSWPLI